MKRMSPANSNSPQEDPVGLCGRCRHVKRVRSDRGPVYYLCTRAADDPRLNKYPRLPILKCHAFEEES